MVCWVRPLSSVCWPCTCTAVPPASTKALLPVAPPSPDSVALLLSHLSSSLRFIFLSKQHSVFHSGCRLFCSCQQCTQAPLSLHLTNTCNFPFSSIYINIMALVMCMNWYLIVVLIYIFLRPSNAECGSWVYGPFGHLP